MNLLWKGLQDCTCNSGGKVRMYMHIFWKRFATVNAAVVEKSYDTVHAPAVEKRYETVHAPVMEKRYATVYAPVVDEICD